MSDFRYISERVRIGGVPGGYIVQEAREEGWTTRDTLPTLAAAEEQARVLEFFLDGAQ